MVNCPLEKQLESSTKCTRKCYNKDEKYELDQPLGLVKDDFLLKHKFKKVYKRHISSSIYLRALFESVFNQCIFTGPLENSYG